MIQVKQLNKGKAKWQLFKWRILSVSNWDWIENQFEFEWTIVPGFTALQILHKIQSDLEGAHNEPEEFIDRIIFMSMFNDMDLNKKGNECILYIDIYENSGICIKFCERTLGIHWTRKRRDVVSLVQLQTRWKMGFHCFQNGENF